MDEEEGAHIVKALGNKKVCPHAFSHQSSCTLN